MRLVTETGPAKGGQRSQSGLAYLSIRADIIAGRLRPGIKLKIQELAEKLKVSPGAVREALSRLVPEGLVVSREQRGFVAAPLSKADLRDITRLRCDIEALALRRSVVEGSLAWEADLVAAAYRLRAMHESPSRDVYTYDDWRECHARFHAALISGCNSPRLIAIHAQLYEQSERYRLLSSYVEPDRDVAGEHETILKYALARDADNLVEASVAHIQRTSDLIEQTAAKEGVLED